MDPFQDEISLPPVKILNDGDMENVGGNIIILTKYVSVIRKDLKILCHESIPSLKNTQDLILCNQAHLLNNQSELKKYLFSLNEKVDNLNSKFDVRIGNLDSTIGKLDAKFDTRIDDLNVKVDKLTTHSNNILSQSILLTEAFRTIPLQGLIQKRKLSVRYCEIEIPDDDLWHYDKSDLIQLKKNIQSSKCKYITDGRSTMADMCQLNVDKINSLLETL
jgi:hypothetical protein